MSTPPEPAPDDGDAPDPTPGPDARRRPVRRRSLREQVLDALREAVADGRLTPGEIHSAPALAERFSVSATPVREALLELVREGMAEPVPNKGFRILAHTPRSRAELGDLRALIEAPLARRAAERAAGRAEDAAALREAAEAGLRAAREGDRPAWRHAELRFHARLLDLAGNREAAAVAEDLHLRSLRPGEGPDGPREAAARLAAAGEHLELADLVARGDGAAAEALMRRHCDAGTGPVALPHQRTRCYR